MNFEAGGRFPMRYWPFMLGFGATSLGHTEAKKTKNIKLPPDIILVLYAEWPFFAGRALLLATPLDCGGA